MQCVCPAVKIHLVQCNQVPSVITYAGYAKALQCP